jgi:hypothetical protein
MEAFFMSIAILREVGFVFEREVIRRERKGLCEEAREGGRRGRLLFSSPLLLPSHGKNNHSTKRQELKRLPSSLTNQLVGAKRERERVVARDQCRSGSWQ